jgi:hypothetical protein
LTDTLHTRCDEHARTHPNISTLAHPRPQPPTHIHTYTHTHIHTYTHTHTHPHPPLTLQNTQPRNPKLMWGPANPCSWSRAHLPHTPLEHVPHTTRSEGRTSSQHTGHSCSGEWVEWGGGEGRGGAVIALVDVGGAPPQPSLATAQRMCDRHVDGEARTHARSTASHTVHTSNSAAQNLRTSHAFAPYLPGWHWRAAPSVRP